VEREFEVLTASLGGSLDALEAALREELVPDAEVLDLRLVAEEVLTNVAKYGYDDARAHSVRVRLRLAATTVRLEFEDDGRPFDPLAAPPPDLDTDNGDRSIGGLGIHLFRSLVDGAEYSRVKGLNVLILTKRLGGARDVP
jgi:anti-sigma regulatory factor (Ser/Thr protein kinase)